MPKKKKSTRKKPVKRQTTRKPTKRKKTTQRKKTRVIVQKPMKRVKSSKFGHDMDKKRRAMRPGRRELPGGRRYTERRSNRSDTEDREY